MCDIVIMCYLASIVHYVIQSVSSILVSFFDVFGCAPGPSLARDMELAYCFLGNALECA